MKATELGLIAAVSPEGVIGVANAIPWRYPADLKRFKALTTGTTVIMGRKTYASIGKPLPNRQNIVITRRPIDGVACDDSFVHALAGCTGRVWCIGGGQLYREAMAHADLIDLTYVPDHISAKDAVYFPSIDERVFAPGPLETLPEDPRLFHRVFRRVVPILGRS